ncbi:MAG: SusC/RagA family TonB-linked outer membrane protein [Chitinophagaceae bacterium]|nr:SusC/RagA family TonB-linked outer membrane protein [Chitinophagaceae bacterium]
MIKMYAIISLALFSVLSVLFPHTLYAQNRIIKGKVINTDNAPLSGVSVTLKGTAKGTFTNNEGVFEISVPRPEAVLQIAYVGYLPQEIKTSWGDSVIVRLETSSNALDSIVVVGYGTQKRTDITGSVASIDQKRLDNLPSNNVLQALQGAVPGLNISMSSASAEGNNVSVDIRGPNSIAAGNTPLYVVDGVVYNLSISGINPNDIASIDVLKDASAAAIYGSRGSNGVILITTKQGVSGSKPVVSFSSSYDAQQIAHLPPILTPEEFYQFKQTRDSTRMTLSEENLHAAGKYTDWLKLATRTGRRTNQNLSVRGGSSSVKYFISADYLGAQGIVLGDNFKRATLRTNVTVDITQWLTFGTNTQLTFIDRSRLPANFDNDYGAWLFDPYTTAYDSTGALTIYPWPEETYFHNPLEPTLAKNSDHTYQVLTNNYLQVKLPLKGLSYKINTGVNVNNHYIDTYWGSNTATGFQASGSMDQSSEFIGNYSIDNLLYYNQNFGKHHVDFTGLYSYEYYSDKKNSLHAEGFSNDVLTYYQADQALLKNPSTLYSQWQLISEMARVNYNYNSKYLLTLTGRRDGSSVFGADHKFGFYPSMAIGWNITNESFMDNIKNVLNDLKLRFSYGSNGNWGVSPYSSLARLTSRPYINGSTTAPGYVPSSLANPDLGWESTNTANIGLDFGLINNRIKGSIEVYSSHTKDLLLQRTIPAVDGATSIYQNIGKTQTKGLDFSINTINVSTKNFTWNTTANLSFYRNKIVSLYYSGSGSDTANRWFIGHPINVNFNYVWDGVYQLGDDIANSPQPNAKPGYAKVKDLNGDKQITANGDMTIIGSRQPAFIWGMGNTFTYKSLSLYVFVHGVVGTSRPNTLMSDNGVQSDIRFKALVTK